MSVIEVQARSYASTREMRAEQKAIRLRLLGHVPPPKPAPQIILRRKPAPHPQWIIGDDAYTAILTIWAGQRRLIAKPPGPFQVRVAEVVANYFSLTYAEIVGKSRRQIYIGPRHIAMYIYVRGLGFSYPEAARRLGRSDHSTVWHGIRKVERELLKNAIYAQSVAELMQACGCGNG